MSWLREGSVEDCKCRSVGIGMGDKRVVCMMRRRRGSGFRCSRQGMVLSVGGQVEGYSRSSFFHQRACVFSWRGAKRIQDLQGVGVVRFDMVVGAVAKVGFWCRFWRIFYF